MGKTPHNPIVQNGEKMKINQQALKELQQEFQQITPKKLITYVIMFLLGFAPLFAIGYVIGHINTSATYCTYKQDYMLELKSTLPEPQQNQTYNYYLKFYNSQGGLPQATVLTCTQNYQKWWNEPKDWKQILTW